MVRAHGQMLSGRRALQGVIAEVRKMQVRGRRWHELQLADELLFFLSGHDLAGHDPTFLSYMQSIAHTLGAVGMRICIAAAVTIAGPTSPTWQSRLSQPCGWIRIPPAVPCGLDVRAPLSFH